MLLGGTAQAKKKGMRGTPGVYGKGYTNHEEMQLWKDSKTPAEGSATPFGSKQLERPLATLDTGLAVSLTRGSAGSCRAELSLM